jgi:peptidoglycan/LPS O-acetylase OafA/YrhL
MMCDAHRLTPVYMAVIACTYGLWNYIGDGPMWLASADNTLMNACPTYWWTNALYINNMWPAADLCADWTWYLANDMQFYWITPPLLVLCF